jgi:hypothetical protein
MWMIGTRDDFLSNIVNSSAFFGLLKIIFILCLSEQGVSIRISRVSHCQGVELFARTLWFQHYQMEGALQRLQAKAKTGG